MGERDLGITADLMRKVSDDVSAAIGRVVELCPEGIVPITTAAIAAALGWGARALATRPGAEPQSDDVLLAALLGARMGTEYPDAIGQAYRDLETLKA